MSVLCIICTWQMQNSSVELRSYKQSNSVRLDNGITVNCTNRFIKSILWRWIAAAYMTVSLKTITHAVLSPYGLYLYVCMYGCVHILGDPQSAQLKNCYNNIRCSTADCYFAPMSLWLSFFYKHVFIYNTEFTTSLRFFSLYLHVSNIAFFSLSGVIMAV